MLKILRPYQIEITNEIIKALDHNYTKILVVSPMGSGKSPIMGHLLSRLVLDYQSTHNYLVAPFTTLVKQLQEEFDNLSIPITCMTYQAAITKLPSISRIDTLILEECHHEPSPSFWQIPELVKPSMIIGFTATPYRLDKHPLLAQNGGLFEVLIEGPDIEELINQNYLANYEYYSYPLIRKVIRKPLLFLNEVYDFTETEKYLIDNRSEDAVKEYAENFNGMTGIIFCKSAEHASIMSDRFNNAGIKSASINCYKSKKITNKTVQDFKDGKITILAACNMASEGLDHPQAKLGILARKIALSQTLYLQTLGRFLRPFNNEPAKILDTTGCIYRFGDLKEAYKKERI
jgi:superfamily II DNA or RNA helicase